MLSTCIYYRVVLGIDATDLCMFASSLLSGERDFSFPWHSFIVAEYDRLVDWMNKATFPVVERRAPVCDIVPAKRQKCEQPIPISYADDLFGDIMSDDALVVSVVTRWQCAHPACAHRKNSYHSTDAVRKHCRKRHADWISKLPPSEYARPITVPVSIPFSIVP